MSDPLPQLFKQVSQCLELSQARLRHDLDAWVAGFYNDSHVRQIIHVADARHYDVELSCLRSHSAFSGGEERRVSAEVLRMVVLVMQPEPLQRSMSDSIVGAIGLTPGAMEGFVVAMRSQVGS